MRSLLIAAGDCTLFISTRETLRDAIGVVNGELRLASHAQRSPKDNGAQRLAVCDLTSNSLRADRSAHRVYRSALS